MCYQRIELLSEDGEWVGPGTSRALNSKAWHTMCDIWDDAELKSPSRIDWPTGMKVHFAWTDTGWVEVGNATYHYLTQVVEPGKIRVRSIDGDPVYQDILQVAIPRALDKALKPS